MNQRYQNLINQITGNQRQAESRESTATSREFGRRGISLQSGIFDQTLNERLDPITKYYTGQIKDVGFEQGKANRELQALLGNLTSAEIEQLRGIQNTIAQIQAGGSQDAAQNALQLLQLNQNQALNQQELAFRQREADRAANAAQYIPPISVGENSSLVDPMTGRVIFQGSGAGVSSGNSSILNPPGGLQNQFDSNAYLQDIDEYVKQYGVDAAVSQGLLGPRGYQ